MIHMQNDNFLMPSFLWLANTRSIHTQKNIKKPIIFLNPFNKKILYMDRG